MAPFVVLVVSTLVFRLIGRFGAGSVSSWRDAARMGVAFMFVFTGVTHFSGMKHDYAAMVPPPLTGQLWVIYATGLLEIAGALGLLAPRTRKPAALGLLLLLGALFPANVYAAVNGIQFRGAPPTDVWLRGILQAIFAIVVWWSAVAPLGRPGRRTPRP